MSKCLGIVSGKFVKNINLQLMKPKRLSKHDRYVLELSHKIRDKYDTISLNVPVKHSKRSLGEADIIARKGSRTDLYEVKCSFRILKAKKQLSRLKNILNLKSARTYFYCGNSKLLVTV